MATIKDVAKASGVSISTVSYVLNNGPRIIPEPTRERVLAAARALRYHPSAVARALQRRRTNTLGIVLFSPTQSPISDPYVSPILDGVMAAASRAHQNVMLLTGQPWTTADQSLPAYCDGRCDAYILLGAHTNTDIIPSLLEADVPFALVNNQGDDPRLCYVDVDEAEAVHQLVAHLVEHGHRRIAMLRGADTVQSAVRRHAAFLAAAEQLGLAPSEVCALPGDFTIASVTGRVDDLLALPAAERPTAVFCFHDEMALVALEHLRRRGVRVPEQLSLVGFDDIAPAAHTNPGLTTMRQPFRDMGIRVVEMLLERLEDPLPAGCQQTYRADLVVRGSVAARG